MTAAQKRELCSSTSHIIQDYWASSSAKGSFVGSDSWHKGKYCYNTEAIYYIIVLCQNLKCSASYSTYIHILLGIFSNADIEGTQVCHIAVVLIYRLLCSLEKLATVFVHMIHRFCSW